MQLSFTDDVLCLALNPLASQVAIALVTGHLHAYSYDAERRSFSVRAIWSTKRHKRACRSVAYAPDGKSIVSVGADKVIKRAASDTGKVLQKFTDAHDDTINTVCWANDNVYCTGDDSGIIKAWNIASDRTTCDRTYSTHEDYISNLLALEGKFILATSGDGTISIHDLRSSKPGALKRSDDQEDDLTCALILKCNSKVPKVIVGGSDGVISIFKRSDIGDCNDRMLPPTGSSSVNKRRGKKNSAKSASKDIISVESMAKVDESSVVVGGSDGIVRSIKVLPNRWLKEVINFDSGEPVVSVQFDQGNQLVFAAAASTVLAESLVSVEDRLSEPVAIEGGGSDGDSFSTSSDSAGASDDQSASGLGSDSEEPENDPQSPPPVKKRRMAKSGNQTAKKNDFFDDL